jgi:PAS domain S-box-containing protein
MNPGTPQTDTADERDVVNGPVVRGSIDESGRAVQLLAGQNRLLESIAKGCPLSETLRALCLFVEQLCPNSVCGVLLVGPAGDRVEHGAGPNLSPSYNEAIHGCMISVNAGPCGMAISLNQQVIADDIASDTRWIPEWRLLALGNGLRACWSTPIHSSDKNVLGTFAIYWREPRRPTDHDQKAINQVTHLAAVAIERDRTELSLRQSEERFRRMADAIPEVIWCTALNPEKVLYVSPSFERIWGLKAEALYANPKLWMESVHPEDRERVKTALERWINGGSIDHQEVEYRILRPNGAIRWIHQRGVLTLNQEGSPYLASGISTDSTDRKQAEVDAQAHVWFLECMDRINRAIQGTNDLEQMMSDVLKVVLSIFNCDRAWLVYPCDPEAGSWRALMEHVRPEFPGAFALGVRFPVDSEVAAVFGRVRGSSSSVRFGPESNDPVPLQLAKRFQVQSMIGQAIYPKLDKPYMFGLHQCSYRRVWTDREQRLFQEVGRRMADALSTLLVFRSLQTSEAKLEEAQRITHVGHWERDLDSERLTWSNETYRIFGLSPQERSLHLSQLSDMIHPDDQHIVPAAVAAALRGGPRYDVEYRVIRPGGEVRFVHSVGEVVADGSGRPRRMFGTVQDITERKQAAEALRASEHLARGQLAALTSTLDLLAQESDPDNLPKHVVTTILRQMGAHSATIWERNGDELNLLGIIEEGRFNTGDFTSSLPVLRPAPPLWVEALETAAHILIQDVNKEPSQVLLSDGRAAVWPAQDLTEPFRGLKARLTAQGVTGLLVSPMMFAGHLAGIIGIRFTGMRVFGPEEIELTQALAHQAMLAVQLMRLSQQSRQAAVEAERNRMARDIHDTLAQGFTGVIVQLEAAADASSKGLARETEDHLRRAADLAREGLGEARRSVRAIRPRALEDSTLCNALEDLIRKLTEGAMMRGEFRVHGEPHTLPAGWDENLLRIGQEILTNALRHAQATEFKARLCFTPTEIRLELRDNGRGFDPTNRSEGFGLIGIKERVESLGGQFTVQSEIGKGTTALVVVPLPNSLSHGES